MVVARVLTRGLCCLAALSMSCASSRPEVKKGPPAEPPPDWLVESTVGKNRICSWGIAGRAYDAQSEAPKKLAEERAVKNLAGVFETTVLEAQIVRAEQSADVVTDFAQAVEVPDEMVEATAAAAETEWWRDEGGGGPLGKEGRGFTYARSCVDVSMKDLDAELVALSQEPPFSEQVPAWMTWIGSRKGAALCAIGFSQPYYDSAEIFQGVVEKIRGQLKTQATTVVMSSYRNALKCSSQACENIVDDVVAATTDALSRGVVVTHFWYDRRGAGPERRKRTAYGWGCVYPVNAMRAGAAQVREKHPEITPETVKKAAEDAFNELEKMEMKHAPGAGDDA